jgi:hypothetical protein
MRWTSVAPPVLPARPNLKVDGSGLGNSVVRTFWSPLPSWKSISTVTFGLASGATLMCTVRRPGAGSVALAVALRKLPGSCRLLASQQ